MVSNPAHPRECSAECFNPAMVCFPACRVEIRGVSSLSGVTAPMLWCEWVQRDLWSTTLLLMQPPEARLLVGVDEDHLGKKPVPYKVLKVHLCCKYMSNLYDLLWNLLQWFMDTGRSNLTWVKGLPSSVFSQRCQGLVSAKQQEFQSCAGNV